MMKSMRREEDHFSLFITNCSIRGVSKAYRAQNHIVRGMWILFIFVMFGLLIFSIVKLVNEYYEYNTTIQTRLQVDEGSLFPAFTICPFQPFSQRAIDYFEKRNGLTPFEFSQKLRKIAKRLVDKNKYGYAEQIFNFDNIRTYYQNLPQNESISMGLKLNEMLVFCMTKIKINTMIGEAEQNCGFKIIPFSSAEYFNCFTVQMDKKFSYQTESVRLIIRFPKTPESIDRFKNISLINTLTKNIKGAEVYIHESDTSPISIQEKIFIEPARLLKISYRNNQWKEYSTAQDKCVYDYQEQQGIIDLNKTYSYTYADCIKQFNARKVLKNCSCILAHYPRTIFPNSSYPYCAKIPLEYNEQKLEDYSNRLRCIGRTLTSIDKMDSSQMNCFRRCEEQKFDLQISSINWRQSEVQLEWIYKLNNAWNVLIETAETFPGRTEALNNLNQFLNASTEADLSENDATNFFKHGEEYACLELERMSNNTFFKEEKLGLTLYGLVSRLGGFCTLYLGLTCAVLFEFAEVICNRCMESTDRSSNEQQEVNKNLTDTINNNDKLIYNNNSNVMVSFHNEIEIPLTSFDNHKVQEQC